MKATAAPESFQQVLVFYPVNSYVAVTSDTETRIDEPT